MAKTRKFVKLGEMAYGFSDPYTGLDLSKGQVRELDTTEKRRSLKIKKALQGGHLIPASEKEFNLFMTGKEEVDGVSVYKEVEEIHKPTLREQLEEMDEDELVDFYKVNYEVTKSEVKKFKNFTASEMVNELIELDEE